MPHDLSFDGDGEAEFAYNRTGGAPWHRLGVPMSGLQTIDVMLAAAKADYEVRLTSVAALDEYGNLLVNPDGRPVVVEDAKATVRVNRDGTFQDLGTVGNRYEVRQNREIAERGLAVIGASNGDAVVDTCGVLKEGRRFFMTIDLGSLVIDPLGVNDKIDRYLVISHGHDGVWPIRYANTDVRAVCNNTVMLGLKHAQRVFTARHTRNADVALEDAREVLRISVDWGRRFQQEAERLLRIPAGPAELDKVIEAVFPERKSSTERQKKNRDVIVDKIKAIHMNERNAGGYGMNAWAAYNAVVEYLDWHRDADQYDRALSSMDDNSWVTRSKFEAHQAAAALG